jgi:hypothetical protein
MNVNGYTRLALLSLILLTACSDTGPIQVGPDRYTISTRVPFSGPAGAKGQAEQEANAFCASKGQKMLLDDISSYECALHGGCGEAELYFFCLDSNDQRYTK